MIVRTIPSVRDLILGSLEQATLKGLFESAWRCGARPLIFAGAARDAIRVACFTDEDLRIRDWDIGIGGLEWITFNRLLCDLGGYKNRYGGYHIRVAGTSSVDVWRLEDTIGVRLCNAPPTVDNVLRSFVLSPNAVAFDPHTELFYDRGALGSLESRELTFTPNPLLHSRSTFAAKGVLASIRLRVVPTPEFLSFSRRSLRAPALTYEAVKVFGSSILIDAGAETRCDLVKSSSKQMSASCSV